LDDCAKGIAILDKPVPVMSTAVMHATSPDADAASDAGAIGLTDGAAGAGDNVAMDASEGEEEEEKGNGYASPANFKTEEIDAPGSVEAQNDPNPLQ